jgi:hypothetical protein
MVGSRHRGADPGGPFGGPIPHGATRIHRRTFLAFLLAATAGLGGCEMVQLGSHLYKLETRRQEDEERDAAKTVPAD